MPLLINRTVAENNWLTVDKPTELPAGNILVPLEDYLEATETFNAHSGKVAVEVTPDDEIAPLLAEPNRFELIAIHFPNFAEGRGFSFARLLRRAGYTGQLRATGYVTRDRLGYMQRCGFDAFDIPDEHYQNNDDQAFDEITVHYQ